MSESDLFMECEEEELEPWQQIQENVQTERMEPFESISTVKQVTTRLPTVVTPAAVPARVPARVPVPVPVAVPAPVRVPAPVPVASTRVVLSGQALSGSSKDNRVSLLTNTQSMVTPLTSVPVPVPISLPAGLAKPDQGQQLIFTQGAGGLSTMGLSQVLLSAPAPGPGAAANQPIILTTQGLPVQNFMAGQNPLGIVLNVQQGQTIKPITLVSGGRHDVVQESSIIETDTNESRMEKLETKLIQQVRLNRHLYDTSMKEHRDFPLAQKSWKEIGEVLGKDEAICRKMWKNLRDKFVRIKRKSERRAMTGYRTTPLQRELAWLSDYVKHREQETNVPNKPCSPVSNGDALRDASQARSHSASTEETCDMSVSSTDGEVSIRGSSFCQATSPGPAIPVSPTIPETAIIVSPTSPGPAIVVSPIVSSAPLPSLQTPSTVASSSSSSSSLSSSSSSSTVVCVSSPPNLEKTHLSSALMKLCNDKHSFQRMLLDKLGQPQEVSSVDLFFDFLSKLVKDQIHPDHHMELQQKLLQTVAEYIKKPPPPPP